MPKVICPCVECECHGKGNVCKADKIKLTYRNMMTVHEGRVDMWICDKYQVSDKAKELYEAAKEFWDNLPPEKYERMINIEGRT